jgi:hypothetical protein
VTTNGATSVMGAEAGFVNLFTKYFGDPQLRFHSIEYKQALCVKTCLKERKEAMKIVTKRSQFHFCAWLKKHLHNLLIEVNSMYKGLLM